jgi:hypothetical protein
MNLDRKNAGYALVVVMGLTAVLSILLTTALAFSCSQLRISQKQSAMEGALYVAQAGAERAAAYVAGDGEAPWSSSGTVGEGTYVVAVVPAAMPCQAPRTISGWININPSSSPQNEFTLHLPDGEIIDNLDFNEDFPGYTGPAVWVHVKPKGNGKQNNLMVDGVPYDLDNSLNYDIFASRMDVYLYNDLIDPQGKAKGKWHISIATSCASFIVAD